MNPVEFGFMDSFVDGFQDYVDMEKCDVRLVEYDEYFKYDQEETE